VPTSSDDVVFDSSGKKDATIDASFAGTVASLVVSKSYTGSITLARAFTTTGNLTTSGSSTTGLTWTAGTESDLHIGGDLKVYSGAYITVKRSSTTGNGSGQSIQVTGNATVCSNAGTWWLGRGQQRWHPRGSGLRQYIRHLWFHHESDVTWQRR
jgi:hypothetical protein